MIEGKDSLVIPTEAEKHLCDHDQVYNQRQEKLCMIRHGQDKFI